MVPAQNTLREYASGGREVFACGLPLLVTGNAALSSGRWMAQMGDALQSFEAPGLDIAAKGWVAAQGSLARTGQPR